MLVCVCVWLSYCLIPVDRDDNIVFLRRDDCLFLLLLLVVVSVGSCCLFGAVVVLCLCYVCLFVMWCGCGLTGRLSGWLFGLLAGGLSGRVCWSARGLLGSEYGWCRCDG